MSRELLLRITRKDFDITDIRGSGPGGQHRNKTSTGIRMRHRASGAVGEATDSRSQLDNKATAFRRCIETKVFKTWLRIATAEALGRPSVDQLVEQAMRPENIETQVLNDNSAWVTIDPSDLEAS